MRSFDSKEASGNAAERAEKTRDRIIFVDKSSKHAVANPSMRFYHKAMKKNHGSSSKNEDTQTMRAVRFAERW